MEIELMDVLLPIENVAEIACPIDELARGCGMQVVVVAEKAAGAVVGDRDVVAAGSPEDVVADFNLARSAANVDTVAGRCIERIVEQPNVVFALNVDADGVLIEIVVRNE